MKNLLPVIYIFAVYLIASIFGYIHYIYGGFLYETPLWEIFKIFLQNVIVYGIIAYMLMFYTILLISDMFKK